ncbi:HvfC/BufC N-terminal domain-containing protein [Pseudomonas mandelii]|uniref:HvfC/BufC N-terminal domain-containing protein n=1 Tax=Pseudomonas mandelii TaxID=75612 RepID=UPI00209D98FC|nr:DNA-binding domain-containing protein [Pseudomonas mandelii]MCO8314036.1 DNA-binding domain-containing protein [Pseudomonas mandelii]
MSTQAAFAAALLDPQRSCPVGLFSANGADPASRFAVYRNNVQSSLINALADSYPVVSQLVGDEFFRAMAGLYVRSYPPQSPLINDYGKDFAEFIDNFEPAARVPYLADVARLERLRVQAYHAADAQPLSHDQIAAALSHPQALGELTVEFHPSLNLLTSAFSVVSIWAAHQQDATLAGIDLDHRQNALVLRNDLEVEVFAIDHGASTFIHNLRNGQSLTQALETTPAFDLSQILALLISHNVITHLHHKVSP